MDTFDALVRALGGPSRVARELGPPHTFHQVSKWARRDRVPAEHWHALLRLAAEKGLDITADDLVRMAAQDPGDPTAA